MNPSATEKSDQQNETVTEKTEPRSKTLLGIADSMLLFVTTYRQQRSRKNGEVYDEEVDVPLKLTSAPIGGSSELGGGCAFTLTEKFCKKNRINFDEVVRQIREQDSYGLRYVWEDDESLDSQGAPVYKRIIDVVHGRERLEREVQNEAMMEGVLHSESMV